MSSAPTAARSWARTYLADQVTLPQRVPPVNSNFVLEHVAVLYNLAPEQLLATRRPDRVSARHVAMYLAREMTGESTTQIARAFLKSDHTTVIYAHRRVAARISSDPAFALELQAHRDLIAKSYQAYCNDFRLRRAS